MLSADTANLLIRAAADLVTLLLLVGVLYRPQKSIPSMPLVLCALNVGLFTAVTAFVEAGDVITGGLGFGLFALLSMLRLRSAAFTIKDVAYTFIVLILGLVNALPITDWALLGAANVALLFVMAVADTRRTTKSTRVMRMRLDNVYVDPVELRAELEHRLPVTIQSMFVKDVDYVRETTDVVLEYVADDRWGQSSDRLLEEDSTDEEARS
ncbi:MAG TPA: DUF4956 domain-containing protein [Aeromicrobium sp.]|nr:DUF4956 domain-containing protein [Aeromicrobium sp.]